MFEQKPHTIVPSIVQRSMLRWWESCRGSRIAPAQSDIDPEHFARNWHDVALYDVVRTDAALRYRIRFQGTSIAVSHGGWVGRHLDETVPAALQPSVIAAYDAAVRLKSPIYTERHAADANGVPVTFERLLLPFSSDGVEIDRLLVHVHMFCPEGRYERTGVFGVAMTYQTHSVQAALTMAPSLAGSG